MSDFPSGKLNLMAVLSAFWVHIFHSFPDQVHMKLLLFGKCTICWALFQLFLYHSFNENRNPEGGSMRIHSLADEETKALGSATCLSQTRLQSWLPSKQSWIYRKQILQVAWMPIRWAGTVALEAWDKVGRQAGAQLIAAETPLQCGTECAKAHSERDG